MPEPRMIQDIQRDEDHEEVIELLTDHIYRLEKRIEDEPVSFTKSGFIGYTLFICIVTTAVWFIIG